MPKKRIFNRFFTFSDIFLPEVLTVAVDSWPHLSRENPGLGWICLELGGIR